LPYRAAKAPRPVRRGTAFVAIRADGAVLLRERPLRGLLGGMLEPPSSPWSEAEPMAAATAEHAPVEAAWRQVPGRVQHTFTHFHLELEVWRAEVGPAPLLTPAALPEACRWLDRRDLGEAALPSVMRKVLAHALETRRTRLAG